MRKIKAANLKTKDICISVPESFAASANDLVPEGISAMVQQAIAYRILGLSLQDFEDLYCDPSMDARFHRDPPTKEYIRAARWVLESQILAAYPSKQLPRSGGPGEMMLKVKWLKTDAVTYVLLRFAEQQMRRVIYDQVLTDQEAMNFLALNNLGPDSVSSVDIFRFTSLAPRRSPFKWRILTAWIRFSAFGTGV